MNSQDMTSARPCPSNTGSGNNFNLLNSLRFLQGVFLTGPPLKMSLEPGLVFVTNITNYIRAEKTVMWRNFNFLYRI